MLIADLTAERLSMLALAVSMKDGSAAISSFAALVMTEASDVADLHASRTDFVLHHFLRQTAGFGHDVGGNLVAVGVLGTTTGLGDLASLEVGQVLLGNLEGGSLRWRAFSPSRSLVRTLDIRAFRRASRPFWSTN